MGGRRGEGKGGDGMDEPKETDAETEAARSWGGEVEGGKGVDEAGGEVGVLEGAPESGLHGDGGVITRWGFGGVGGFHREEGFSWVGHCGGGKIDKGGGK